MSSSDDRLEHAARASPEPSRPITLAGEPPFNIGALEVNPRLRRIAGEDGREELVEPRVMQVLVALAKAGGDIVTRDELLAACWNGVIVGEDAIERVVGRLRRLGQSLGEFRIETVSKVGYRLRSSADAPVGKAANADVERPRVCVLPFLNMSDDPQQEYFSDGITEDVITDLSKVSALFVVARTTAFALRGAAEDLQQLARRLNVGYVLEGSVRKADGRLRITAQLIDGASGGHLWAERYDRELADIFAVQDEISKAIVRALELKLAPAEKKAIEQRETSDAEAYDLCLMARRYYGYGRVPEERELDAIVRLCRRATEIDPGYVGAWTLLALADARLHFSHDRPGGPGRMAAERGLALDPARPELHAVRARYLWNDGRPKDAWAEVETALTYDPDCWDAHIEGGRFSYLEHQFDNAVRFFERAMALSGAATGACELMSSYHAKGDAAGVRRAAELILADAEQALAQDHVSVSLSSAATAACVALGQVDRARSLLERGLLLAPENAMLQYNFACALSSFLKDADGALATLGEAFPRLPASVIEHAKRDPDLELVRGDPRFQAMVAAASSSVSSARRPGD
jgi:adenylate cyclase